jgi:hypothetical protein
MGDSVQAGRLVARATTGGTGVEGAPARADLYQLSDLVYQLWGGKIDLSPLGPLHTRVVDLLPNLRACLSIAACGHIVEVQDGAHSLCEVVAALECDPLLLPVMERPLAETRAEGLAVKKDVAGLGVRTALRIVELTPGRTRWLATLAHDPRQASRAVVATTSSGEPRILVVSPPASARVTAAYVLYAEGKMVLTESSFVRC